MHNVHKQRFGRSGIAISFASSAMVLEQFLLAIHQVYGNEPFYFQQDGTSPYYHTEIRSYLYETLSGQWIGQRGSVEYPNIHLI